MSDLLLKENWLSQEIKFLLQNNLRDKCEEHTTVHKIYPNKTVYMISIRFCIRVLDTLLIVT